MSNPFPSRILAIDYGRRHIGLAISDPNGTFALPLTTLKVRNAKEDKVGLILEYLADQQHIEKFVVGNPLHMSGKPSEMSQEIQSFSKTLEERSQKPVVLIDERLTSGYSDALLKEQNYSRKERAKHVHNTSAMVLLQSYLDMNTPSFLAPKSH